MGWDEGEKTQTSEVPPSPPIPEGSLLVKDTAREMLTKEAPKLESEDEKETCIVVFFFYHADKRDCAHTLSCEKVRDAATPQKTHQKLSIKQLDQDINII